MATVASTRRRFMQHFATTSVAATLAPGILWAKMQDTGASRVTLQMVTDALSMAGVDTTEAERQAMVAGANQALARYETFRRIEIPNDVSPPFHFSAIVPGIEVDKTRRPVKFSDRKLQSRPANLEDVAFWPVRDLAELIRTRKVTSLELTEMYLG